MPTPSFNRSCIQTAIGGEMSISRITKLLDTIGTLSEREDKVIRNIRNCICLQYMAGLFVVSVLVGVGLWK